MQAYKPSGAVPVIGAVRVAISAVIFGSLLGIVACFGFYKLLVLEIGFMLPLLGGLLTGFLTGTVARREKFRNPWAAAALAAVGGIAYLYVERAAIVYALCPFQELGNVWNQIGLLPLRPDLVFDFSWHLYEEGSWGLRGGQMVKGPMLVLLWVGEAAAVIGASLAVAGKLIEDPFCESCQEWLSVKSSFLFAGDGVEPVWQQVISGYLEDLALVPQSLGLEYPYVELTITSCPSCSVSHVLGVTTYRLGTNSNGQVVPVLHQIASNLVLAPVQAEMIKAAHSVAPLAGTDRKAEGQGVLVQRKLECRSIGFSELRGRILRIGSRPPAAKV